MTRATPLQIEAAADRLIDQQKEPFFMAGDFAEVTARLHYWRDKAINVAYELSHIAAEMRAADGEEA